MALKNLFQRSSGRITNVGAADGSPDSGGEFQNFTSRDTEKEPYGAKRASRGMNRIDGVRRGSKVGEMEETGETDVSIGKQMELEAGNAIQYRTCSWYKVFQLLPLSTSPLDLASSMQHLITATWDCLRRFSKLQYRVASQE